MEGRTSLNMGFQRNNVVFINKKKRSFHKTIYSHWLNILRISELTIVKVRFDDNTGVGIRNLCLGMSCMSPLDDFVAVVPLVTGSNYDFVDACERCAPRARM